MDDGRRVVPGGAISPRERRGWGLSEVLFGAVLAAALVAVVLAGRFAYREGVLLETAKGNAQAVASWAQAVAAAHERNDTLPGGPCALVLGAAPAPAPATLAATELASAIAPQGQAVAPEPVAETAAGASAAAAPHVPGDKPVVAHADKVAPATAATAEPAASAQAQVTWKTCHEALFAQSGALANLSNPFDAANTVLGTRCEKRNPATRGLVLVEKGGAPPPGTSGSLTWAALEEADPIAKGVQLRIQVCDAGGYLVKVAEVKL